METWTETKRENWTERGSLGRKVREGGTWRLQLYIFYVFGNQAGIWEWEYCRKGEEAGLHDLCSPGAIKVEVALPGSPGATMVEPLRDFRGFHGGGSPPRESWGYHGEVAHPGSPGATVVAVAPLSTLVQSFGW